MNILSDPPCKKEQGSDKGSGETVSWHVMKTLIFCPFSPKLHLNPPHTNFCFWEYLVITPTEWSFNIYMCAVLSHVSRVQLFVTPRTIVCQAPLSMGILQARILEWLPSPLPGDVPDPEIKPSFLLSPALAGRFFTTSATWEVLIYTYVHAYIQTSFLTYNVLRVGKLSHWTLPLPNSVQPLTSFHLIWASRKMGIQVPVSQIPKVIMAFHKTFHWAFYSADHVKINAIN